MQDASPTKDSSDAGGAVSSGDIMATPAIMLPEHAAPDPQPQKTMVALEVIFFYLHEACEAAKGWNLVTKHAGQVCASRLLLTTVAQCMLLWCAWPPSCACWQPAGSC